MIYNEEFETLPREVLEALQLKRLKQVVQRVYHTVGFYRRAFDEAGVQPDDIKTLDDLKKFPFTTKQDLRDNYPFGLFAVPMSSVVRLHASSGTTGPVDRRGIHQEGHRYVVGADGPLLRGRGAHEERYASTMLTATACSPAGSGPTTGPKSWGQASFPSPAATRNGRS